MSTAKMPVSGEVKTKISRLRADLEWTQEAFAKKLGVSRIAVVNWENGESQPGPRNYMEIAKLAKPLAAVWFWKQAGIDEAVLRALLPEFNKSIEDAELRVGEMLSSRPEVVIRLPLLRTIAHVGTPHLAPADEIERWVSVPAFLVLNPVTTSCVRLPDERASLLGGEDLYVFDSSITEPNQLLGQMVIANCDVLATDGQPIGAHVGFLHPLPVSGPQIFVLTNTRTPEATEALDRDTFEFPIKPTKVKGLKTKVNKVVVSGLAARVISGDATMIEPELPWSILGRVVGVISSVQQRPGAPLKEISVARLADRIFRGPSKPVVVRKKRGTR
jgi:DNA-binding XRE family transcriptional regulator